MQTPASRALETAQMSICRRRDQYKGLHPRLPNQSVYDLFASQICLLQVHLMGLGAFRRLNQMAVQKKAGADLRTDFPNASRTSMVHLASRMETIQSCIATGSVHVRSCRTSTLLPSQSGI